MEPQSRSYVRRIALSGLVALAAVLGVVAVPAAASAQSTAGAAAAATDSIQARQPMLSCATATNCLGFGGVSIISNAVPVPARVARWNGSTWKGVGLTLPKGDRYAELTGVSCRAANSCVVVGLGDKSANAGGGQALALAYNGTSLRPLAVPLPKATTASILQGVSCATARDCVAVGIAGGRTAAFGKEGIVTIVETWNGSRWSERTLSAPGKALLLSNVSCSPARYCMLAGDAVNANYDLSLYLASWNGKKIAAMKPPALDATYLESSMGLSCASRSSCALVGTVQHLGSGFTTAVAEIWNGATWRPASVRWPQGTLSSELLGVSCYAAGRCVAAGDFAPAAGASFDDTDYATAVSIDGAAGALQPVPVAASSSYSALSGVSCPTARSCVAIGVAQSASGAWALISKTWNGRAWKFGPGF
jgi:hypothetical protein